MFKIASNTIQMRKLLLTSRRSSITSVAQYTRSTPCQQFKRVGDPERDACKEPPIPEKPPADDRFLWGTLAAIIVTGGFAYYAKSNPEIRDWLTIHAPWFDDLIAVIYKENYTYTESAIRIAGDIKKAITNMMDTRECTVDEEGNAVYTIREVTEKRDPCNDEKEVVEEKAEEVVEEEDEDEDEDKSPPCIEPPIPQVTEYCEMEACLKDIGDNTTNNYMTARDACIVYNKLVNDAMLNFSYEEMRKLRQEKEIRNELVNKSLRDGDYTFQQLKNVLHYVECGGMKSFTKEQTEDTINLINQYINNATIYKTEFTWENATSQALDVQWIIVECTMNKYADENMSYYSKLNFLDNPPDPRTSDVDFLLIHSKKYIRDVAARHFSYIAPRIYEYPPADVEECIDVIRNQIINDKKFCLHELSCKLKRFLLDATYSEFTLLYRGLQKHNL